MRVQGRQREENEWIASYRDYVQDISRVTVGTVSTLCCPPTIAATHPDTDDDHVRAQSVITTATTGIGHGAINNPALPNRIVSKHGST
ncbi:hypothetical protein IAQ61_009892 [Plenodomus lingam]|uniref:uncharacterized protein n=1 Tax=Leptosphaeria maculans TaxID=5022 RepID=UPI00331EE877|nr:hypothetical protein IAQ61_009892 [Plenodomus lingam]